MLHKMFLLITIAICVLSSCQTSSNNNRIEVDYDSIRIVLEDIYDKDQNIRKMLIDSLEEGSPEFQNCISNMIMIDNENQKVLIPLLEKYGWISSFKIGKKASESLFYVIQHSKIEVMETYFPQLDSLSKIGEAERKHAAMMEDRLLMWRGQKQIYGSQATTTIRSDGQLVIWPVKNPNIVDSLRQAAGFEQTVSENAQRIGAFYNPLE